MVNLFGAANQPQSLGNPAVPPVTEVLQLRAQGLTNNQIVDKLQREGFRTDVISTAFTQADAKGGMIPVDINSYGVQNPQNPMNIGQSQFGSSEQSPRGGLSDSTVTEKERIEELAEAIIDEKWNELVKSIEKIAEWKERTESRLDRIEEAMESMKSQFSDLHKGVLGKIGEYDNNITDIGSEIKALEKVFQKILPTFTENVNELTRITKELKEKK
ncbi:MAG: hypothetical protein WC755_01780 [Candidatus Woesearchaeota archaeon]|jgi:hypothetical protein